jgi:hypothetical protein
VDGANKRILCCNDTSAGDPEPYVDGRVQDPDPANNGGSLDGRNREEERARKLPGAQCRGPYPLPSG